MNNRSEQVKTFLTSIATMNVWVVGDGMLDHYIWGNVHRISPEAPVPVVAIEKDTYRLGGACNVALNLQKLGASVRFFGPIGADDAGQMMQQLLTDNHIHYPSTDASSTASTIVKTRVIARNQQLFRLDREKVFTPDQVRYLEHQIEQGLATEQVTAVIVSDYAKGSVTQSLLNKLGELKQKYGFFLAIDPKPGHGLNYSGADLLKPNQAEARQLAKLEASDAPLTAIAQAILHTHRVRYLAVTLGEDGLAIIHESGKMDIIPTVTKEVFDVSGAGDTALVALTAAFCAKATPEEAGWFANLLSGLVIKKVGTASTTPEEILNAASKA